MATSLMTEPCGDICNKETEYLVNFVVLLLEMSDKESSELFNNVLVNITWDGNVIKLQNETEGAEKFKASMDLQIYATPIHLSEMLKKNSIMLDLSRGCNDLGTIKFDITDCFADAVLCDDFNSQTVTIDLKFVKEESENAVMSAYFRIQKLLDDGVSENLFKELNSKKSQRAKKQKKKNSTDKDGDCDEDSEKDPCDDLACTDDLPDHCKRELGLNQNVYRIINGNLINLKDQIGPCGEVCPVAGKYIKQLCKAEPENRSLSSRFKFDCAPKCNEIFKVSPCDCNRSNNVKCPECGGCLTGLSLTAPKETYRISCKGNWIDRNIREEDLLKKLCNKYGINVDEIRAVGQETEKPKCKKIKKKKMRNVKKAKNSVKCKENPCDGSAPFSPALPTTREKFLNLMKRKCRGKYSFDFGSSFSSHCSYSKIEKGAGAGGAVPKYMGWRWDTPILGICDKKWYPGQINPMVRCLMKHALNPFPYDTIPLTRRDEKGRVIKTCNDRSKLPEFNPQFIQKPTLRIQKRDGEYFITMNPLKEKEKLETDCNPYLDCTPLQFKIKDHPEEIKIHRAMKLLRDRGLEKKCSCVNLTCCRCKSETQKKLLVYEMKRVSKQLKMEKTLSYDDLNPESDSELDLQFTTPSAIVDCRKCKSDVVHCGTQYTLKDFAAPKTKVFKDEKPKSSMKGKPASPLKKLKKNQRKMESILIDPPCRPIACCAPKCVGFRC